MTNITQVDKFPIPILTMDPLCIKSLSSQHYLSFLKYVPERYGRSPALTAVTDCLLARVKYALVPTDHNSRACDRLYGHALHALQIALNDEKQVLEADILCATQIMSLHGVSHDQQCVSDSTTANAMYSNSARAALQHARTTSKASHH